MAKCIDLLPFDWLIRYLGYRAVEQVCLIEWPVSVSTEHKTLVAQVRTDNMNIEQGPIKKSGVLGGHHFIL